MKVHVTNYTFNAASKQITFPDYTSLSLDQILVISNATRGTLIYNFADPALIGSVAGNVLTLNYDTAASMNDADKLIVFFDNTDKAASDATLNLLLEQNALMRRILKFQEIKSNNTVNGYQQVFLNNMTDSIGRMLVRQRDTGNSDIYGTFPWPSIMWDPNRTAVATAIRSKLIF